MMRLTSPLFVVALVSAPAVCADTIEDQAELARATQGRLAGKPVDCITRSRTDDFSTSGETMIFRPGSKVTYLNRLSPGCDKPKLRSTLVFRSTSGRLCRGEIVQSVDPQTGVTWGSCTVGQFVPYTRP